MKRHPDLSRRASERKLRAIGKEMSAYDGQSTSRSGRQIRREARSRINSALVPSASISDTTYRDLLRRKEMIEHERPDTYATKITD